MTLGSTWALAVVAVVGMGLLAVASFRCAGTRRGHRHVLQGLRMAPLRLRPRPRTTGRSWLRMSPGSPFPITDFVHIHMAAASQVTGIDLPLIYLRFLNLPLVLLVVLLYVTAGLSFARSAWVCIAAATMALLVGGLQLETTQEVQPFLGVFVPFLRLQPELSLWASRLPCSRCHGRRANHPDHEQAGRLDPRGGACCWGLERESNDSAVASRRPDHLRSVEVHQERRIHRPVLVSMALLLVVGLATYLSQYASHSSGLRFGPFATFDRMPAVSAVKDYLAGLVDAPLEGFVLGAVFWLVFIGLLAGMIALLAWARISQRSEKTVWLLASPATRWVAVDVPARGSRHR